MTLLRNTAWGAAGSITLTLGRMAIVVILARRLGPESFGLFVFVQWLIEMTFMVFSFGLSGVATRFFPQSVGKEAEELPGFNHWFFRAGVLAVLLTSCFAALSAYLFSDLRNLAGVAAITFWAAATSFSALLGARAQGLFQYKRNAASSAIFVIAVLSGLALLQGRDDLLEVLVVMGAANIAAGIFLAISIRSGGAISRPVALAKMHSDQIFRYATNAWVTSIVASLVWARGEIPMIKGYLGEGAVGYYSIGLTLSGIINQGVGLLTGALWPQIARAWDNGNKNELAQFSSAVTNLLMLIAGLAAGFIICFAPYIVTLLFGEKFLPSSNLVLILALGALGLTSGCAHLVIQAATNGKFARDVTIAGAVFLYGAAFILIPRFGIEGAAVARSATQIGMAVLVLVWIGKVLGHSVGTRHNLRSLMLLVMLAGSLAVLRSVGPELHIWSLCAIFVTYCGLVWLICLPGWKNGILHELRKLSRFGNA
ncbi:MAG TPA: oligosaccharide flippase family protein [Bacteriovoracaceae bacterium]|nr:oligosaccharide flippase family protein [Bacteriovoracaceae bacterium]